MDISNFVDNKHFKKNKLIVKIIYIENSIELIHIVCSLLETIVKGEKYY
jgi:hypothetical protein